MKRRRNPIDIESVVSLRVPLACIVALQQAESYGADVRARHGMILIDVAGATSAGVYAAAEDAQSACGSVIVFDGSRIDGYRKEIVAMIARTLYVYAWSNRQDELGRYIHGDVFDMAPRRTPARACVEAVRIVGLFEQKNGFSIEIGFEIARQIHGKHYVEPTAERFGFAVAMQALGTGVAWGDDHPDPKFKIPHSAGI